MSEPSTIAITGVGASAPERVLTNAELETMVETSDEWITTRTGIKERRIAEPGVGTSDIALGAAQEAIAQAGIDPLDIDLIFMGTASPDMIFPSAACLLQDKLGAKNAFCMDMNAACSGYIYAMDAAWRYLRASDKTTALVVGADKLSNHVNWDDRTTCILFGDGAGACILQKTEGPHGLVDSLLGSDGSVHNLLKIPSGGSRQPLTPERLAQHEHTIHMEGREVFKHAVTNMTQAATSLLERHGVSKEDIKLVIPHQANARIISAIGQKLGLQEDQVFMNVQKFGNTSAASIGLAMKDAYAEGRLQPGDKLLLVAFGGGFTWGAMLVDWMLDAP